MVQWSKKKCIYMLYVIVYAQCICELLMINSFLKLSKLHILQKIIHFWFFSKWLAIGKDSLPEDPEDPKHPSKLAPRGLMQALPLEGQMILRVDSKELILGFSCDFISAFRLRKYHKELWKWLFHLRHSKKMLGGDLLEDAAVSLSERYGLVGNMM